jgi:hypothetical protein
MGEPTECVLKRGSFYMEFGGYGTSVKNFVRKGASKAAIVLVLSGGIAFPAIAQAGDIGALFGAAASVFTKSSSNTAARAGVTAAATIIGNVGEDMARGKAIKDSNLQMGAVLGSAAGAAAATPGTPSANRALYVIGGSIAGKKIEQTIMNRTQAGAQQGVSGQTAAYPGTRRVHRTVDEVQGPDGEVKSRNIHIDETQATARRSIDEVQGPGGELKSRRIRTDEWGAAPVYTPPPAAVISGQEKVATEKQPHAETIEDTTPNNGGWTYRM